MKQTLTWLCIPWLLCAVYVFGFHYPAAMDIPNHIARAHVLNTCIGGSAEAMCQNFLAQFQPISYFFADYTIMLMLRIFADMFLVGKIALFLLLSINLLAWYYLFKRVRGEINAAYLGGLLLLFNNFFYKGFYAYLLGNGAFLLWLAFWWPRRDSHSFRTSLALSVGLVALFLCHLAAFFSALICYGAYALWTVVRTPEARRSTAIKAYAGDWFFFAAFVGIYGFQQFATGATILGHIGMQGVDTSSGYLNWWIAKFVRLAYVTLNHSKYFDTLVFGLVIIYLATLTNARLLRDASKFFWIFCACFFIAGYFVTPDISHGGSDVDLRFLLPGYFIMFLGLGAIIENSKRSRVILAALVSVQFAFNFCQQIPMQQELASMAKALDRIPPGQRLVEVNSRFNFPTGTMSRVNPFSHFATYYMVRGGNSVDGMLNCHMNPNIPYFCYRNAQDSTLTFKNQFQGLPALNTAEIQELLTRFDYFLVIEPSRELVESRMPAAQFEQVFHEGDVYLLKKPAQLRLAEG